MTDDIPEDYQDLGNMQTMTFRRERQLEAIAAMPADPQTFTFGQTVRLNEVARTNLEAGLYDATDFADLRDDPGRLFTVQGMLCDGHSRNRLTVSDQRAGKLRNIPRVLLEDAGSPAVAAAEQKPQT